MIDTIQQPTRGFDFAHLNQLREECEIHSIDMGRVSIVPLGTEGHYLVTFDKPMVDIERFAPGMPSRFEARSAGQAEGLALMYATKIQVAERQVVRHGAVCGWDQSRINRTPISADELNRYRARLKEAALQARMVRELREAAETAQAEANQRAADDLAARYPNTVATPRQAKTPPAPVLLDVPVKPTQSRAVK